MGAEHECLGCGAAVEFGEDGCPACGWDPSDFAARGRYGLATSGHGEPEDDGDGASGPPPGPDGLRGL